MTGLRETLTRLCNALTALREPQSLLEAPTGLGEGWERKREAVMGQVVSWLCLREAVMGNERINPA